jgi:hypothetical protein
MLMVHDQSTLTDRTDMTQLCVGDIVRWHSSGAMAQGPAEHYGVVLRISGNLCTVTPISTDNVGLSPGEGLVDLRSTNPLPQHDSVAMTTSLDRITTISCADASRMGAIDNESLDKLLRAAAKLFAGVYSESVYERKRDFVPGNTTIPATGKVIGKPEILNMVDASMDGCSRPGALTPTSSRAPEVPRCGPRPTAIPLLRRLVAFATRLPQS